MINKIDNSTNINIVIWFNIIHYKTFKFRLKRLTPITYLVDH